MITFKRLNRGGTNGCVKTQPFDIVGKSAILIEESHIGNRIMITEGCKNEV